MDKRILLLIVVVNVFAGSVFAFRKFSKKEVIVQMVVDPKTTVSVGDSVSFTDNTEGAAKWMWNFGDNELSNKQADKHAFLDKGTYEVKLTVEGDFGLKVATTKVVVTAKEIAPSTLEHIINGPSSMNVNQISQFESSVTAGQYKWFVQGENEVQTGKVARFSFRNTGRKVIVLETQNPNKHSEKEVDIAGGSPHIDPAPANNKKINKHHKPRGGDDLDVSNPDSYNK